MTYLTASHRANCCMLSSLSTLKLLCCFLFFSLFFGPEGRPDAFRVCCATIDGARYLGIVLCIVGLEVVARLSLAIEARHWLIEAMVWVGSRRLDIQRSCEVGRVDDVFD